MWDTATLWFKKSCTYEKFQVTKLWLVIYMTALIKHKVKQCWDRENESEKEKVQLSLCLIKHYTIKTYGEVEV
jgi:hypothetical protein